MGVAAAVIAVLAILAGKYGTVHALTQQLLAKNPMREVTDEFLQLSLASSIVDEWTESGHAMTWPQGKSIDTAEKQEDFPPEVWKETMKRWDDTPGEKREEVRSLMKHDMEAARANIASSVKWDAFKSSFDFMDVIFIGLALLSSFRIGSIRSKAAPMAP